MIINGHFNGLTDYIVELQRDAPQSIGLIIMRTDLSE